MTRAKLQKKYSQFKFIHISRRNASFEKFHSSFKLIIFALHVYNDGIKEVHLPLCCISFFHKM